METDEATKIAEQEIICILVQDKARSMRIDMNNACDEMEMKLNQQFLNAEAQRNTQEIATARRILVHAVRRWLARKELKRRCSETFEKHFDARYKAFYYRNSKTVSDTIM